MTTDRLAWNEDGPIAPEVESFVFWKSMYHEADIRRITGDCVAPDCPNPPVGDALTCGDIQCVLWLCTELPDNYHRALLEWQAVDRRRPVVQAAPLAPVESEAMDLRTLGIVVFAMALMGGVCGAGWMVLAGQVGVLWVTR